MPEALPTISIVTPTYNRADMIERAIRSVLDQDYPAVEHIIVDACSTDGTSEVLAQFPQLRVIREPDRGVYDGLNKGIRAARGEIIGHLNSDDVYAPGTFFQVARHFAADPELDVVSGSAAISELTAAGERRVIRRFDRSEDRELGYRSATIGAPLPNARFFRRRVYERVGLYDISLPVAADRDFLIRVALAKPKTAEVDTVIYDYLAHRGSLTLGGSRAQRLQSYIDLLHLTERYMRAPAMPEELRRHCLALHRDIMNGGSIVLLAERNWRELGAIFGHGFRSDTIWPARLMVTLARRLAMRARRHLCGLT
jgi:glycosyltransferase involved in cell wall biosynthesis